MSRKYLDRLTEGSMVSSEKVKSKFGEKMLKKMGWKEGEGLGKHKTGEVEPIQVRKRKENLGVGGEATTKAKWNHNWWEELFNDTVKNIKVDIPRKRIKVES
mmetsp:Transcript_7064/g.6906  ORF Transcript_7064/g.6906 Transcript_7064/m.6906 type:complete len:102 (-) Transcript_7064:46-351(-)